ncbi:MAG: hypothetical protein K2W97_04030 [Chthoniobacterales bacterium]|nr:hypothetical protein [Chthoniobacterales bacterium]
MISPPFPHFHTSITAKRYWISALLLLFALCYYGSYYRCSLYPSGEGGVEGVTALRLLEGKTPFIEAILNYNLFWFYPIVALFKIFGPSYTVLRIFFFFLASLTGLLSFYVVSLTTKRPARIFYTSHSEATEKADETRKVMDSGRGCMSTYCSDQNSSLTQYPSALAKPQTERHEIFGLYAAALAGLLTLILPGQLFRNYMAFLVMLNMALFFKAFLYSHPTYRKQLGWIGAAGLSLSLTFLIRVDLGFFLTIIFFGLALLFPWVVSEATTPVTRRLLLSIAALSLGALGFLALHAPVYCHALHRGFAPRFATQYQQWPHMITTQATRGLKKIYSSPPSSSPTVKHTFTQSTPSNSTLPSSSSSSTKTTLLRASFSSSDLREKITALNLYLPIITSLLLILMAAGLFFKKTGPSNSRHRAFLILTSLACSLTLFPQYFFWRPDMVHLSEFMVPMTVTILMAIVFALEAWPFSKIFLKILLFLFLATGIATLSLYFINGCQSQSTGGIAISEGRTKEFFGENGVHVKLKPHEWEEASAIYQSILRHSKQGEYVVCFPYNPEINFMTNRPSYRYDLYCDDVTAPRNFDEIAIREIETFHPPVIVITNWPINGTEHSRFTNWAAPTYAYIKSHYALDYSKGIIQVFIHR